MGDPGTASKPQPQAAGPPPSPKSPPMYPGFCRRRRLQLEVQILNREVGFLEEELQSLEGLQTVTGCCKDVNNFVGTKADPFLPISKRRGKSKCMWRWLSGCFVELEEPNSSCQPNCSWCKIQCQCPCKQFCRCSGDACIKASCSCSSIHSCKLRGLGDMCSRSYCNCSGASSCRQCCNRTDGSDGSCCSCGCCKWSSCFKSFCCGQQPSCCGPLCKFLKLSCGELSCSCNCSCFRRTKISSSHRFTSLCCFSGCLC